MPKKYTSEQFWELYEKLPQELKDALFAEETGNNIYEVCQKNETEGMLEDIVDLVGQALVGLLPPEEFQNNLEKELGLEKETAKKVAHEINRFVFYPVKPTLEQLYSMGTTAGEKKPEVAPLKTNGEKPPTEEKPAITSREDTYREPIE